MGQILDTIDKLEKRERALNSLCGEMLATLLLEKNEKYIPDKLRLMAEGWGERRDHLLNENHIDGYDES